MVVLPVEMMLLLPVAVAVAADVAVAVAVCSSLVFGGTNNAVHETIEGAALAYVLIVSVYHLE